MSGVIVDYGPENSGEQSVYKRTVVLSATCLPSRHAPQQPVTPTHKRTSFMTSSPLFFVRGNFPILQWLHVILVHKPGRLVHWKLVYVGFFP